MLLNQFLTVNKVSFTVIVENHFLAAVELNHFPTVVESNHLFTTVESTLFLTTSLAGHLTHTQPPNASVTAVFSPAYRTSPRGITCHGSIQTD